MAKPRKVVNGAPQTKLSELRELAEAGDWRGALRIAARFPQLGEHKARIERGWAAVQNPGFMAQLGRDPAALEADAIAALRERYGI